VAQVPINSERTIYATIGDAFAWLCAAGFLGMSVWGILR
jgi:apolipoprotein N-acyltransferase